MMKMMFSVLVILMSIHSLAASKSPRRIRCEITARQTTKPIDRILEETEANCGDYGCDKVSRLMTSDRAIVIVPRTVFECHSFEGQVQVCESGFEPVQGLEIRYHNNTQNGAWELADTKTEQSAYFSWMNQYDVTESGFLHSSVWLTNTKGGLAGDARIYQVEASCYASNKTDWK